MQFPDPRLFRSLKEWFIVFLAIILTNAVGSFLVGIGYLLKLAIAHYLARPEAAADLREGLARTRLANAQAGEIELRNTRTSSEVFEQILLDNEQMAIELAGLRLQLRQNAVKIEQYEAEIALQDLMIREAQQAGFTPKKISGSTSAA